LQRSQNLLKRGGNDPDTGLFDRAGLIARAEQEHSRSRRYSRPLVLAVLRAGNAMPKEHLRAGAILVRGRLRAPDVVGHLGEGTYSMVLPECTPEDARIVLSRVIVELQELTDTTF